MDKKYREERIKRLENLDFREQKLKYKQVNDKWKHHMNDPRVNFELGNTGFRWRVPFQVLLFPFSVLAVNKCLVAPSKTYYDITNKKPNFAIKGLGVFAIFQLFLCFNWKTNDEIIANGGTVEISQFEHETGQSLNAVTCLLKDFCNNALLVLVTRCMVLDTVHPKIANQPYQEILRKSLAKEHVKLLLRGMPTLSIYSGCIYKANLESLIAAEQTNKDLGQSLLNGNFFTLYIQVWFFYPLLLLNRHVQVYGGNAFTHARSIWKAHGIYGFWRGQSAQNAFCMFFFLGQRALYKQHERKDKEEMQVKEDWVVIQEEDYSSAQKPELKDQ